jgi:2-iminobutanoate/2-iminopropanoate deaminase
MRRIQTEKAPKPVGPYSQGVRYGNFVFVSGQLGIDPSSGKLLTDFEEQARQCLKNLEAILNSAGASKCSIVKVNVFLKDIRRFSEFNKIYEEFLKDCPVKPARSVVEVSSLPLGAELEVECIAVIG